MLRKEGISPWGKNRILLLIRGLIGTAALFCIFEALAALPLASATIIQYTYPTFTAIGAWVLLGEKIRSRIILAILLGWVGISLVVKAVETETYLNKVPTVSIIIALIGAILTALAYVCVRKLSNNEHPLVIVHYFPLVSIPITLPFVLANGVMPLGIEWIWLLGVGILTQLGQVYITKGLSLLTASHATSISYAQVLFATIWGALLFSEPISNGIIIGGLCILGSTIISLSSKTDLKTDLIPKTD